jgi:uncharacterized protein
MTRPGDDDLRERLRRALPAAMKARDRPALAALRSALAAIDNAEAVDPAQAWPDEVAGDPGSAGWEAADTRAAVVDASHAGFAGTVAGVGATEVKRRSLSGAQVEDIVRAEIEDREVAAAARERARQHEQAERLRAEARVLLSHLDRP